MPERSEDHENSDGEGNAVPKSSGPRHVLSLIGIFLLMAAAFVMIAGYFFVYKTIPK
jgi:hypothetical protein